MIAVPSCQVGLVFVGGERMVEALLGYLRFKPREEQSTLQPGRPPAPLNRVDTFGHR